MATVDDLRRIVAGLPATGEKLSWGRPFFTVKGKGFGFLREDDLLALHVADLDEKDALLVADPERFTTTSHYDGHAMVLVRLGRVDVEELAELVTDSWRNRAPSALRLAFDDGHPAID